MRAVEDSSTIDRRGLVALYVLYQLTWTIAMFYAWPEGYGRAVRLRLVLAAEKERKTKKQYNYVKTDRSAGRAQSERIRRARSAASASEASSEVYAPESSNNKSQ